MSRKQYQLILALFHEYNEAFQCLSPEIKDKFYGLLNGYVTFTDAS